ncbi:hypothetical protein NDU88_003425 [Pleurodeles waltl]|uniref:Uncharacterized protein n=1 Tax=Pleurodeles waltl TaxID=8319 RepID=A0AAV7V195_PLEWA|nr:hypothetical protein NDU88_003425 [Pleurodeles waltl]
MFGDFTEKHTCRFHEWEVAAVTERQVFFELCSHWSNHQSLAGERFRFLRNIKQFRAAVGLLWTHRALTQEDGKSILSTGQLNGAEVRVVAQASQGSGAPKPHERLLGGRQNPGLTRLTRSSCRFASPAALSARAAVLPTSVLLQKARSNGLLDIRLEVQSMGALWARTERLCSWAGFTPI